MIRPARGLLIGFAAVVVLGASAFGLMKFLRVAPELPAMLADPDTETVNITEYAKPRDDDSWLVNDRIEDKKPTFDPALVNRRPVGQWELNGSAAVIRLDVPMAKPDQDAEQLALHPSYASAIKAARRRVLPSVNMIDGKAKQFDDGLYAAIDQAYFLGRGDALKGHLPTLRRMYDKVARGSPAADYLAAGLSLGGAPIEASPKARAMARAFLSDEVSSKPIAFYTWTKGLSECFRVLRYFAMPIDDRSVPVEIARVLREDRSLKDDYVKAFTFYAGLTNPLLGRTPADLVDGPPLGPDERVTLFPPSSSRESELFLKLYPRGLPAQANLMRELITAIRSGRVNLKPRDKGGWYDYQVYALETLLLPERAAEANQLLLTKPYKKRMLEAFQALMTKRRETHARQFPAAKATENAPVEEIPALSPRLRVEPNPTYYLRTARSYAFLTNFLGATLGESTLKSLKGLREGGEREPGLDAELHRMRDLFYGLALLSAEDIGLRLPLLDGEGVNREACEKLAKDWLATIQSDPDLAVNTRVSVPVYHDPATGLVRIWATIGVRLAALESSYARPPSVRPRDGSAGWTPIVEDKLYTDSHLIPVDEFAEVEVTGGRVYNRAELRAICDRMKTKAKIVEAMGK